MEDVAKNNDTLGDLYALRAGLSLISQNFDEMNSTEKIMKTKIASIIDKQWYTKEGDECDGYRKIMFYLDIKFKKLEEIKKDYGCIDWFGSSDEYKKIENENEKREYIERFKLTNEMAFCEWLKTSEVEEYFTAKKNNAENDFDNYQKKVERCKIELEKNKQQEMYYKQQEKKYKILTILTVPTIVGAIICKIKANKHNTKYYLVHSQLNNCNKELTNLEGKLKDIITELKKYDLDINNIKDSREIIKQNDEENMPILSGIKRNSNAIYASLQKSFNKMLDERDWKHLDLIIFYLETGRAESMKEALQLLDAEMQNKRIVGAIQKATESICSTIERVASKISVQLGVISNQLSLLADIQQIQMEQNIEIISQTKLQNALIEKSNVTSEKLMKDFEHIKKYGIVAKIT